MEFFGYKLGFSSTVLKLSKIFTEVYVIKGNLSKYWNVSYYLVKITNTKVKFPILVSFTNFVVVHSFLVLITEIVRQNSIFS